MGRRSVDQLRARSQFGWEHSYDVDHRFKCVLHPLHNRMPHLHSTSGKSITPYCQWTLELQPDWFLNPSKIVISREAFWSIGKHCRIEMRCDLVLRPEDAGAEVADWAPELGRNGAPLNH
jgi:hypothetical protein